jgi:hypothetical protein
MNAMVAVLLGLAAVAPVWADVGNGVTRAIVGATCVTRDDWLVGASPEDLRLAWRLVQEEDAEALTKLVTEARVRFTTAGLTVFVVGRGGDMVEARPKGEVLTLWFIAHGLDCPTPEKTPAPAEPSPPKTPPKKPTRR